MCIGRRCRTLLSALRQLLPVGRMIGTFASYAFGVLLTATRVGALDNGVARLPGMSSCCSMSSAEADWDVIQVMGYNSESSNCPPGRSEPNPLYQHGMHTQ